MGSREARANPELGSRDTNLARIAYLAIAGRSAGSCGGGGSHINGITDKEIKAGCRKVNKMNVRIGMGCLPERP